MSFENLKNLSSKIKAVLKGPVEILLYLLAYVLILLGMSVGLPACSDDDSCEVETTYIYYEPVYTSLADIRSAVTVTPPKAISTIGKIYFKDHFLFVNQPNKGIHVIDNSDPSNPAGVAFIEIPGSFDLAIRGNILFTDSYMDLVAIDISNRQAIKEIGRYENMFSQYNSYGFYVSEEQGVVTDWVETQYVDVSRSPCSSSPDHSEGIVLTSAEAAAFDAATAVSPVNPGIGGSMARFTIANDHLFAINGSEIIPVDIADAANIQPGSRLQLEWGLETLFPRGNNVFVGSNDGLYILDVSSALAPSLISKYEHITSCDPVVVHDTLAYVTLRSGSACAGFTDQLEIINIADLTRPQLLHVYPMYNPHGLGIDNTTLFICDGEDGLKVFDASDITQIDRRMTAHYQDLFAYDIIPFNNVAMLISADGLYQYDYTDINNITLLSKVSVDF